MNMIASLILVTFVLHFSLRIQTNQLSICWLNSILLASFNISFTRGKRFKYIGLHKIWL